MKRQHNGKSKILLNGIKYLFFCWPFFSVVVLFFTIVSILIPLLKIDMIEKLVDTLISENNANMNCYIYILVFSGVILLEFIIQSRSFLDYFGALYQKRYVKKYYQQFLKSCMGMPYQGYEDVATCDMIEKVKTFFKNDFALMMITFYRIIVISAMLMATLVKIGKSNVGIVVYLLIITLVIFALKTVLAYMNMKFRNSQIQTSRKLRYLFDLFTNKNSLTEMDIYNNYQYLQNKREEKANDCLRETMNSFKRQGVFRICLDSILPAYVVVAILLLFYGCNNDTSITPGLFLALTYTIQQFQSNIDSLAQRYNLVYDFVVISNEMNEFIEANKYVDSCEEKRKSIEKLEIKKLSFNYPNSTESVLDNISFTVHKGEKIAIVGLNGAGKSTLIKLLVALYENYSGEIKLDDINVKDIPKDVYYKLFSCVFQDYNKYYMSVRENVLVGNIDGNSEEVKNAIDIMRLNGVLARLENGIDSMLGKEFGGQELSGGEWQKIAIARAIYRDAEIMVFDEPTSALDPIAEYELFESIFELFSDKTLIFISHRLASAKFVDKVLFMENGHIVESGSHQQLMIQNGKYASLYKEQQQWYKRSFQNDEQNVFGEAY